MSLATPDNIRTLQRKLYLKAKAEPAYRFYLLYDKIHRADILRHAYDLVRSNKGAPGVDGVGYAAIEASGLEDWLSGICTDLRTKTYQPQPVRRVMIPKPGGGERPLGIPTIRDRVVQTAAKLVLEPIFEADLEPTAYGYRPGRSGIDAVKSVHRLLCQGFTDVVDADLSKYFDTIPHDELLCSIAARIVDRHVLRLIKMWLKAPVEETDPDGRRRMNGGKQSTCGTPQGGVISPLLANRYMNRFLRHWRNQGRAEAFRAHVVNYADDFVILSRGYAEEALAWTRQIMTKLGLTVNEAKTSVLDARQERFDFLGYSFGPHHYRKDGHWYLGASPSHKSVQRLKARVGEIMVPSNVAPWDEVRVRLNRLLRGWAGYFAYGTRLMAYRAADNHVYQTVRGFLKRRHKVPSRGTRRFSDEVVFGKLVHRFHEGYPRGGLSLITGRLVCGQVSMWWMGIMAAPRRVVEFSIGSEELAQLEAIARSRSEAAIRVERARMLLAYHANPSSVAVGERIGVMRHTVRRCVRRAERLGVMAALDDSPRPGKVPVITPEARVWLVSLACQKAKELGYPHELWTTRLLARHARAHAVAAGHPCMATIVQGTVCKILARHEVKPHKVRYYLERRDEAFEAKMAEVLCVYREVALLRESQDESRGVAIISYDEKPGIQAIGNTAPDLPPQPGSHPAFARDHEYKRHGTLSLLAGIDLLTGQVHASIEDRHRSREFVGFLKKLDAAYPADTAIKVILDNHSAHISKETKAWVEGQPEGRFTFVFTPKHGSWLNLVEGFFSKMARSMLRHIRVASKAELKTRILAYLDDINRDPLIHHWTYKIAEAA